MGCPYKYKCKRFPLGCCGCKHNDEKDDYYEPKPEPYNPFKYPHEYPNPIVITWLETQ